MSSNGRSVTLLSSLLRALHLGPRACRRSARMPVALLRLGLGVVDSLGHLWRFRVAACAAKDRVDAPNDDTACRSVLTLASVVLTPVDNAFTPRHHCVSDQRRRCV